MTPKPPNKRFPKSPASLPVGNHRSGPTSRREEEQAVPGTKFKRHRDTHRKRPEQWVEPNDPDLARLAREELDNDMTGYAHLGYRMARGASL